MPARSRDAALPPEAPRSPRSPPKPRSGSKALAGPARFHSVPPRHEDVQRCHPISPPGSPCPFASAPLPPPSRAGRDPRLLVSEQGSPSAPPARTSSPWPASAQGTGWRMVPYGHLLSCFSGAVEMPGKGRIKFWETREGRTRPTGIWLRGEEWECRCFSEVDSGSRASRWAAEDRRRSGRAAGHPGRGGRTVGAAKTTVQGQTEQNTEGMRKSSEDSEVSVETQLIRCKQRPVRKKKKPPTFTPEISKYEHLGRNKNSVGATLGKYLKLRDDNENLK